MIESSRSVESMLALPFSRADFLAVFGRYNTAIGPWAPWLLAALAAAAVVGLVLARDELVRAQRSRRLLGFLALLWGWSAIVYHWSFFRSVNPAASLFAALFAVEALLLTWAAVRGASVPLVPFASRRRMWIGGTIIAWALAGYPLAAFALGHRPPLAPTFGAPCPVVLLTLGTFAWAVPRIPWHLLAIPLAWAALGTSAALQLGMWEDLALPVAALLLLAVRRAPRSRSGHPLSRPLAA
jgi:hypothetical protein